MLGVESRDGQTAPITEPVFISDSMDTGAPIPVLQSDDNYEPPTEVIFTDSGSSSSGLHGKISWSSAQLDDLTAFDIYFMNDELQILGTLGRVYIDDSLYEETPTEISFTIPENREAPTGATKIGIYSRSYDYTSPIPATLDLDIATPEEPVEPDPKESLRAEIDRNEDARITIDEILMYLQNQPDVNEDNQYTREDIEELLTLIDYQFIEPFTAKEDVGSE